MEFIVLKIFRHKSICIPELSKVSKKRLLDLSSQEIKLPIFVEI